MQTVAIPPDAESDQYLVDALEIPEATLNKLFAALAMTALGSFIGGNLLFLEVSVFERSGPIALACLAVLSLFYTLARSLGSVTWGLVITYVLIWAMTYGHQPWLIGLIYACAAFGFLYMIRFLRVARRQWGFVLLMGIIGTATAFTATQTQLQFNMLPRLHAGNISQDLLYNAAIAAMIKSYGSISTGLHGLVEMPYHAFSHTLMAGLSLLSGRGTSEVYGVAKPVLFIPILVFSVVACAMMLDRRVGSSMSIAWSAACALLVGAPQLLGLWMFPAIYFISESYLVALGIFLLGLPLLFKTRLVISDLFLVLLLTMLISNAKVSVGLLFAGLWLMRWLFIQGERPVFERIATLSALVAALFVTLDPMIALGSEGRGFSFGLLSVVRAFSFGGHWISEVIDAVRAGTNMPWRVPALAALAVLSFYVFHFSFSWIVIGRVI